MSLNDVLLFAELGGVALVAGIIDAIAGGGGLLCLPALGLAGLDPLSALATNKLQGTFGTASSTFTFARRGLVHPRENVMAILTCFMAAALGVVAVNYIDRDFLKVILPPVLIAVALYFLFAPKFSTQAQVPKLPFAAFTFFVGPMLAFYDGIFGPGTGAFFMLALTGLFGKGLLEATGHTKLFNLTSNIASLLMFAIGGHIVWGLGLVMGLGQLIGAQIGARLALKNGVIIIKPVLVVTCIGMAIRLWVLR